MFLPVETWSEIASKAIYLYVLLLIIKYYLNYGLNGATFVLWINLTLWSEADKMYMMVIAPS